MAHWKWPRILNPYPEQHAFSKDYPPSEDGPASLGRTTEHDDTSENGTELYRTSCHDAGLTTGYSSNQAQVNSTPQRSLMASIRKDADIPNEAILEFSAESGLGRKGESREAKAKRERHLEALEYYRKLSEIHHRKSDQGDKTYITRTHQEDYMNELKAYYTLERKREREMALVLSQSIQIWMMWCEYEGGVGWPGSKETNDRELERAQGGIWAQDR